MTTELSLHDADFRYGLIEGSLNDLDNMTENDDEEDLRYNLKATIEDTIDELSILSMLNDKELKRLIK